MNISTKMLLSVLCLGCLLLVGESTLAIRLYPNLRRNQRVYHLPSTSVRRPLFHSWMPSNHIPQSDAPVSFHNNLPNSLPPLRSSNFNIQRIPIADNHLPEFSIGTANYANQRNNKMAPSYYRNGNHHHITIPVSRNSVTRITVPLVNVQPPSTARHNLYSSHTTALWPPHTLNRNFQNHASTTAHQHPYQSSVMPLSAKKHHLLVHVGTKQRPSIQQHHVTSPNLAYHGRNLNNNYYTPSARNGLHVNSNRAVSTRTNTHSQSWRLLSPHPQVSTFVPSNQMHHPVIVAPTQQSKTYNDWRNSLGTSAFQRKPQRNHNSRHYLNVNLKNPSRNNHRQSKKSGSNNFANMVTTSVSTPSAKLNERKLATVHIYLRHPQKHFQNSTVGTTPPPKVMAVPSNCIRCPSNQLLVIEKGKSCATVTVPPIKLCSWLSKRPGKLEMELGVGPRPGKSVKEGNYIMQFHLFKGGAKVQTCQFRINVKALRCPLIHPSENGAMQCTNNALWGSTCNFSCKSEYTLVGKPSTTCDGDKTAVFWSNPPPVCKALQCPQIHSPENSVMNCTNNTLHGSTCNFKCSFGYTLEGEPATTCDGDKATLSWSTPPPVCKEKIAAFNNFGCQAPDNPNNGGVYCEPNKVNGTYSVGSACYFMCDSGYIIPSHLIQYGYIICLGSEWNITHNVECHPTHCEPPDEPENGFAQCIQAQPQGWTERGDTLSTNFLNGTKCQYKCDDGYAIPTSQLNIIHTKCIAPFWNNSAVPQCLASHCSPLSAIQNGLIKCTFDEPNSYAISSECYYDCQSGYVIPTSMQEINGRICLPSAKWNVTHIPTCKKRIVPKPEGNACHDIEIQTSNASSEVLSKPSFLTADGKAAEVTCTFLNVSYEGSYENTCKATDPELQTTASCRYKITVKDVGDSYTASSLKGHECSALKAPTNGKIRCQSEGSKFRCSIQCNKGFSLPSSFTKLNNNFVECDRNDGHWDFQKEGETDLPDCLAESLTTTLQVPLKFLVVVNNCSDYIGLNNIMGAIQHSLLSRIKEECDEVDCSDFSHICGEDNITNESVLETTHQLKATYNATEHENNEEISEAEANINKLMEIIKRIVTSDTGFKEEISNAGGNLRQDSFYFDIFKLACPETGYAIDPDTLKCFECPRGTFEEDGKCKPCPGNHYQDITGRTYCKPCPHGTISKDGSRSKSDCQEQEHDLILPEANREQALTESTVFTNCDAHPCRNGGTCNIMLNSFTCICKDGYTGKQCESIICPENYCLNEGKCTSFSNNVVGCSCPKFFSGSRCEVYTEPEFCSSNPCKNNGTCILEDDSYKCHCHSDYMGEHCQIELCNKRFKQWYCLNGGICSKVLDSPICLCREEYTGVRCQHKKDNASPS